MRELNLELYEDNLIQNIEVHLSDMQNLLRAAQLKLRINTKVVIINGNMFSPDLALKIIDRMGKVATLNLLTNKKVEHYLRLFAGVSISSIGGFILIKFLKCKFF